MSVKARYSHLALTRAASTVYVKSSNETFDMLTSWISSRGLNGSARSLLARVKTSREACNDGEKITKKALQYLPYNSDFYTLHNGRLLFYSIKEEVSVYSRQEKISITCLGRSPQPLKDFLKECREEYLKSTKSKTSIFGHSGCQWVKEKTKEIRPLSTVILREQEKNRLVQDLQDFLKPKTRSWYARRSIPYRRGYLLHGPPGTGKSSFSFSIAGELGTDIYVDSIPSANDQTLKSLFAELPGNSVVLLEDIDAVESTSSRELETGSGGKQGPTLPNEGVTLSGLLNVLDGVTSQEDRILIMTTNHIDKLDAALIRPGRVDMRVEFQLADREVAEQVYHFIVEGSVLTPEKKCPQETRDMLIERRAKEFPCKIPEGKFSPAQIMSYLLQHRDTPDLALENAEQWVEMILKETEKQPCLPAILD